MITLGIETSCDETAFALLRYNGSKQQPDILAELVSSQIALHQEYGGVVPELAAREHLRNLPLLHEQIFSEAGITLEEVDCISVTSGPGLKGCLLMGMHFAQALARAAEKPLVCVNHIEGHIWAGALKKEELRTPFLALVVSGGHTEIVHVHNFGTYEVLAKTIDDAAGEAFDKSANLLGFPYPGGAELSALADTVKESPFTLPKVMREAEGFSFSGLKTAIALLVKKNLNELSKERKKAELAYAIQDSIVDSLVFKLKKALSLNACKQVVLCGGVAANSALRKSLTDIEGLELIVPEPKHCMDNAAMIAYVGGRRYAEQGQVTNNPQARPRWSIEDAA